MTSGPWRFFTPRVGSFDVDFVAGKESVQGTDESNLFQLKPIRKELL